MELVTVACIALNRIGSANSAGFGFGRHRKQQFFTEVIDDDVDTLRQKVIEVAEANGEREGALHNLTRAQNLGFPPGQIVFDVQGISTQYSAPYAADDPSYFFELSTRGAPGSPMPGAKTGYDDSLRLKLNITSSSHRP
ncbi:hypothetical protein [Pseudomonas costantinii]|uniref:hypothetical protein n=1 Tax=Pseudomonas costantinii TaxID=168469 RepID=UPI00159F9567|nr:hypothetical protein [Pseudomonas costantinii]NVZ70752.1 hypothetical protein [Pseudomonas costantinii]